MSDDVIDRLDALLHKRRSYVAQADNTPVVKVLAEPEEEDIPVLTEVFNLDTGLANPLATTPESLPEPWTEALAADLATDMASFLRDHLELALPQITATAVQNFSKEIQESLERLTQGILQDFVAERSRPGHPFIARDDRAQK